MIPGEGGQGRGSLAARCAAPPRPRTHWQSCLHCPYHQRPSDSTGSPGRTVLLYILACCGIDAMTCLATPLHRVVNRSNITPARYGRRSAFCCVLCDLVQESKRL